MLLSGSRASLTGQKQDHPIDWLSSHKIIIVVYKTMSKPWYDQSKIDSSMCYMAHDQKELID